MHPTHYLKQKLVIHGRVSSVIQTHAAAFSAPLMDIFVAAALSACNGPFQQQPNHFPLESHSHCSCCLSVGGAKGYPDGLSAGSTPSFCVVKEECCMAFKWAVHCQLCCLLPTHVFEKVLVNKDTGNKSIPDRPDQLQSQLFKDRKQLGIFQKEIQLLCSCLCSKS